MSSSCKEAPLSGQTVAQFTQLGGIKASIALLAALALTGCTESRSAGPQAAATPTTPAAETTAGETTPPAEVESDTGEEARYDDGTPVPGTDSDDVEEETAEEATEEPSEEEPRERPAEVAQWTLADFKSAKVDKDPKLTEAVQHIDQNLPGNDGAAKALISLLTVEDAPKKPAEEASTGSNDGYGNDGYGGSSSGYAGADGYAGSSGYAGSDGYGGGGYSSDGYGGSSSDPDKIQVEPELAAEVIAVLGRNGSKTARAALATLVTGKVTTPLNPTQTFTEAIHAILLSGQEDLNEVAFQLATAPEEIIVSPEPAEESQGNSSPYGGGYGAPLGGELTAEWVRLQIVREIEQRADSQLRHRLAEWLKGKNITQEIADPWERMLAQNDPRNLAAQVVMFQYPNTAETVRQQITSQLAQSSRGALAHLMGIDADSGFGSSGYGGYGSGYSDGYGDGYGDPYGSGYDGASGGVGSRDRFLRGSNSLLEQLLGTSDGDRGQSRQWWHQGLQGESHRVHFGQRPSGRPSGTTGVAAGEEEEPDPTEAFDSIAELLWTPRVAQSLGTALLDADLLSQNTDFLQILSSMPTTAGREQMQRIADKFGADGPQPLTSAGLLSGELMDPSFLITAKKIYHEEARRSKRTTRRSTSGSDGYGGFGGGGSEPHDIWQQSVESYLGSLAARLQEADSPWPQEVAANESSEEGGEEESADPSSSPALEAMDMRLHPKGEVVAEYHLRWPDQAATRLENAQVAPLEIHYVRLEGEESPTRLISYYKRQAGSGALLKQTSTLEWYDGFSEDRTTGEQESIDIRISIAPGATGANLRPTEPREMIVEIFKIVIPGKEPEPEEENSAS